MVEVKIMTPQRRFEYSGLSVESPSLIRPIFEKADKKEQPHQNIEKR